MYVNTHSNKKNGPITRELAETTTTTPSTYCNCKYFSLKLIDTFGNHFENTKVGRQKYTHTYKHTYIFINEFQKYCKASNNGAH